jgi:hypothetical protein
MMMYPYPTIIKSCSFLYLKMNKTFDNYAHFCGHLLFVSEIDSKPVVFS